MAVLAGFVNRAFALPATLSAMGVLDISVETGTMLDTIGIWAFFIVIAGFAIWVTGTFLTNVRKLKGEDAGYD